MTETTDWNTVLLFIFFLTKISNVLADLIISDNELLEQSTPLFLKKCIQNMSVRLWHNEFPGLCFSVLKLAHHFEHTIYWVEGKGNFSFCLPLWSEHQVRAGTDYTGDAQAKTILGTVALPTSNSGKTRCELT